MKIGAVFVLRVLAALSVSLLFTVVCIFGLAQISIILSVAVAVFSLATLNSSIVIGLSGRLSVKLSFIGVLYSIIYTLILTCAPIAWRSYEKYSDARLLMEVDGISSYTPWVLLQYFLFFVIVSLILPPPRCRNGRLGG
jgi:hypothetical protein